MQDQQTVMTLQEAQGVIKERLELYIKEGSKLWMSKYAEEAIELKSKIDVLKPNSTIWDLIKLASPYIKDKMKRGLQGGVVEIIGFLPLLKSQQENFIFAVKLSSKWCKKAIEIAESLEVDKLKLLADYKASELIRLTKPVEEKVTFVQMHDFTGGP